VPFLRWFERSSATWQPVQGMVTVDLLRRVITLRLDATSAPSITQLTGTRFAAAARRAVPPRTSLTVAPRCLTPPRRGAASLRLRVRLSQAARTTIRIQRRGNSPARRVCPRGPRRRPFVPGRFGPPRTFVRNLPTGTRTLTLPLRRSGTPARAAVLLRLPVLRLTPGTYQVTLVARNANGATREVHRSFIVLRP
jgi:hypothetical protein